MNTFSYLPRQFTLLFIAGCLFCAAVLPASADQATPNFSTLRPANTKADVSLTRDLFGKTSDGGVKSAIQEPIPSWVEQYTPSLVGRTIVEVSMEMALSDKLLARLEKALKKDPSLTDEMRAEETRRAAMATSVGGIGPLVTERIIAQGELGADVIGVSLLYDKVWVQRLNGDGTLVQELVPVTRHLRRLLKYDRKIRIEMYNGVSVEVAVWKAPNGTYGEGTVYFLDVPSVTDVIGGRANVVYPGESDIAQRAQEARFNQSWILGRGMLALMKSLNRRPDLVVISEAASMFAHHRLFQDPFQTDPLFSGTKYVFNDHTPLDYAHPDWTPEVLRWLKVDPRYYQDLPVWTTGGKVDATEMAIIASNWAFGVSEKHGRIMRGMPLLAPFRDKIDTVTNGVSPRYWPQKAFQDLSRIAKMSDEELLVLKERKRHELIQWLADRQGLGQTWVEKAIRERHAVGLWMRRIVDYKRLDRLTDLLANPDLREAFLETGVILVFGGRIHQDDRFGLGQYQNIQAIIHQDTRLKDRIIFFENYNIWEAPRLFRGADFSVMLADRDREASATGFQKMQMNGGLIVATEDGAVSESVTFYDGKNEVVANGFLVPYDDKGSPTAAGLLEALEQFSGVFRKREILGKMVRNALNQSPRISIHRTVQEMLKVFAHVVQVSQEERMAYEEGGRVAGEILERFRISPKEAGEILAKLENHPSAFTWKYKEGNARERTLYQGGPGLGGFLSGYRHVHAMGTVGLWSASFHAWGQEGRGDAFAYLISLLEGIPSLEPLRLEIERRAEEAQKTPAELWKRRLEASRMTIGMAAKLKAHLEAVSARDGNTKPLDYPNWADVPGASHQPFPRFSLIESFLTNP